MTTSIAADIDFIIKPWIANKEHINLVIGVIHGEDRWVKGWSGLGQPTTDLGKMVPPDGSTLFEIGSITKIFTATLLSILMEQGELALTTPINQLGSNYQKLPDVITLQSLATHTSGLPRLPDNLQKSLQADPQDPYAAYTSEDLHEYLQNHDGRPGKTFGRVSYSNLAAGILGNILAEQWGQSYEEAVVQQICRPLGLPDTRITLSDKQHIRFAMGYSEDSKPVKPWHLPTLAGAGALRSTANDLLTFLAAHLQPEQTPMAQALLNTHALKCERFAPTPGFFRVVEGLAKGVDWLRGPLLLHQEVGVALGWFMEYLPKINYHVYTHAGGTGGYRSFCGFIKETQTGVVVLSNYGELLSDLFGQYSTAKVGLKVLEVINSKLQSDNQILDLSIQEGKQPQQSSLT